MRIPQRFIAPPTHGPLPRTRRLARKAIAALAACFAVAALAFTAPTAATAAETCAAAWSAGNVYTGGQVASHQGKNWTAQWWTQGDTPGTTGQFGVWRGAVDCGGSGGGGNNGGGNTGGSTVITESQFNQMFPNRNSFYTFQSFREAFSAYPAFGTTGDLAMQRREVAAFLANISHETGGLVHIKEVNTANYPHYCDATQPYGCPAGQSAYYGKGPIQLSWNFNYKAAGDALGIDLLNNPYLVEQNSTIAWKTALWFWNTQSGAGTMSGHQAIVGGSGFGESIRSINGSIECNGGNTAQVESRVQKFRTFANQLGTTPGANLYC